MLCRHYTDYFVSNNEGRTWKRLTSKNLTINAIQIDPLDSGHILIGTEYRGVLRSEDAGETWTESNAGFIHKNISWILPHSDGSGGFVAGVLSGGGGIYSYDETAADWTLSQIEPGLRILSFLLLPEGQGRLAGTTQGVYWQKSSSDRWTKMDGTIAKRTVYSNQ